MFNILRCVVQPYTLYETCFMKLALLSSLGLTDFNPCNAGHFLYYTLLPTFYP